MKKYIIIALISLFLSLFSLGLRYPSYLSPEKHNGYFKGIKSDLWLHSNSSIELPNLLSRGNWLDLKLADNQLRKAEIIAVICKRSVTSFVSENSFVARIYYFGNCKDKKLNFKIKNAYLPGGKDNRKLGAQISSVKISSRLGIPIVSLRFLVIGAIICFLLSIAFFRLTRSYLLTALIIFIISLTIIYSKLDLNVLASFYAFITCFLLGATSIKPVTVKLKLANLKFYLILGVIFLVGLVLRFYNLNFGLPLNYHPDEIPKYNAIMRMYTSGNLNPDYFLHPSLLLYSTYFFNSFLRLINVFQGSFESSLILAGRTVSVLAGSFSIIFVALIARVIFCAKTGLIAASFLAIIPLHVTCSRYLKEDALLTLFVLICVWFLIKSIKSGRALDLFLSALFAGIAASTKYTGILCIFILLLAPFLRYSEVNNKEIANIKDLFRLDPKFLIYTLLSLILVPVGFLICSPYALINSAKFIKDFSYEKRHMSKGHSHIITAWSQLWMYHWERSIVPGMTILVAYISALGLGSIFRTFKRNYWLIAALFLIFYLPAEWVKAKPAPQPERYIVPCLPFLCIAVAYFFAVFVNYKKQLSIVAVTLLLLSVGYKTICLSIEIGNDTRLQMTNWISDHIPKGSKIYLDWKYYNVNLDQNNSYKIEYLPRSKIIPSLDINSLKTSGFDYLVLSSLFYDRYLRQPNVLEVLRSQIEKVFSNLKIVKQIKPKYGTYGFHNPTLTVFALKY